MDISLVRCRQCGGRLCTRLADVACIACGMPWTPPPAPKPLLETTPAPEGGSGTDTAPRSEGPAQSVAPETQQGQQGHHGKHKRR